MTKTAKLIINKPIGASDPFMAALTGISDTFSSADCAAFIAENPDAEVIHVDINTDGGSTSDGYLAYDMLVNSGKKIISTAFKANSIGTVLFLAGTDRNISNNAQFFVHFPRVQDPKGTFTSEGAQALADALKVEDEKLLNFYATTLGWDDVVKAEVSELMKKETDLKAEGALKYGFATAIINGPVSALKSIGWSDQIAAIFNQTNNFDMTKIVTKAEFTNELTGLKKILAGIKASMESILPAPTPVKATTENLTDGTPVYYAGDSLGSNIELFSDEAMTIPFTDGNYVSADGDKFTVAEGKITEFTDADEVASVAGLTEKLKAATEELEAAKAATEEVKAKFTAFVDKTRTEFAAIETKFNAMAEYVPGESKEVDPGKPDYSKMSRGEIAAYEAKQKTIAHKQGITFN